MATLLTKPVRRCTPWQAPHGVRARVVITLYPGGTIGLREAGRRLEITLDASTLYARALLVAARAKRKRRK